MNYRIVFSTTGMVLYIEAGMLVFPALIALGYREGGHAVAFLIAIGVALLGGFLLRRLCRPLRPKTAAM